MLFWTQRLSTLQLLTWLYIMSEINLRVNNLLSFLILSIQLPLKAIIFIAGLQTVLQKSLDYFKGTPFPRKSIALPCPTSRSTYISTTTAEEFE